MNPKELVEEIIEILRSHGFSKREICVLSAIVIIVLIVLSSFGVVPLDINPDGGDGEPKPEPEIVDTDNRSRIGFTIHQSQKIEMCGEPR